MIKIMNLKQKTDHKIILDNLHMNIPKGSIYGLLGENGSGKTTILKYLAGIHKSPAVTYEGMPIYENLAVKEKIFMIPDVLPNKETLYSLRKLIASLYPHFSLDLYQKLLAEMELDEHKKMQSFSKGMVRQAYLALAIATRCEVLLLDEPMDGIDPFRRQLIYQYLFDEVSSRHLTIVITSHNLQELEDFVDTIGIMKTGKMILEGNLDKLKKQMTKVQVAYDHQVDLSSMQILDRQVSGSLQTLIIKGDHETIIESLNKEKPLFMESLNVCLEDLFVTYVGGDLHESV